MAGLLERDPERRLSARQAQQHPWFQEQLGWEAEAPRIAADMPRLISQVSQGAKVEPGRCTLL